MIMAQPQRSDDRSNGRSDKSPARRRREAAARPRRLVQRHPSSNTRTHSSTTTQDGTAALPPAERFTALRDCTTVHAKYNADRIHAVMLFVFCFFGFVVYSVR